MFRIDVNFDCPGCAGALRDRICHTCRIEIAPIEKQPWKWYQRFGAVLLHYMGFEFRLPCAYRYW